MKSFDQTFSKVWPAAAPPEAKFVLFTVLFVWFSLVLSAGIITVEPNGVITPGSTLTINIRMPGGLQEVEMEIARLESGDAQTIIVPRTPVADGNNKAPFIDGNPGKGVIEIALRLTPEFSSGSYIFRVFRGKGGLDDSVMIEVENRPEGFVTWFKETVKDIKETLRDSLAISRYFKGGTGRNRAPVYGDLFLMDGKTYEVITRLTETGDCLQPTLSPGGKQVAYIRWLNNTGQLWLLDIDKDKPAALPRQMMKSFTGSVLNPLWSPDGKAIAFLSGDSLWVMKVEGETPRQVMEFPGIQQLLAWTRDGGQVIFAAKPGVGVAILTGQGELLSQGDPGLKPEEKAALDIWQVDIHGGKPQRLLYDASWLWLPYLAPDGSMLMFSMPVQQGGSMLWTREEKDFTRAEMIREGFDPAWTPEGDRIVFGSVGKK
jgi:hypothetical protein